MVVCRVWCHVSELGSAYAASRRFALLSKLAPHEYSTVLDMVKSEELDVGVGNYATIGRLLS